MAKLFHLLCMLPTLCTVLAVREEKKQEQLLDDFVTAGLWEPKDEDGSPDAISQECTGNEISAVLNHTRLGNYTAQELMETRCDEMLLVMLHRQVQRIQLLELLDEKKFAELFPLDFAKDKRNKKLIKSVIEGSLTAAGLSALKAFDLTDNIGMDAYSVYAYAAWLQNDLKHPEKEALALITKGALVPTPFWKDVPLGIINDVFRTIDRRWSAVFQGNPIVTQDATLLPASKQFEALQLQAGTFVQYLTLHAEVGSAPGPGYIYVGVSPLNQPTGWIKEELVAPDAWFVAKKRLRLCFHAKFDPEKEECPDKDTTGWVEKDEKVKVQSKHGIKKTGFFWMTFEKGGGNYLPAGEKFMQGPLARQDAILEQELSVKAMDINNMAVKEGRLVSNFNMHWNSKVANHAKMVASGGLILGGILTHGLLFLIAGLVYGLGSAGGDMALAVEMTALAMGQVTYVMMSLLHLERQLFLEGGAGHIPCPTEGCPKGFTCLREGVFIYGHDFPQGWCVRSPWKDLVEDKAPCAAGVDCESGKCKLREKNEFNDYLLIHQMTGNCTSLQK